MNFWGREAECDYRTHALCFDDCIKSLNGIVFIGCERCLLKKKSQSLWGRAEKIILVFNCMCIISLSRHEDGCVGWISCKKQDFYFEVG